MRALILVLAAVVIGLAALIISTESSPLTTGPVFDATRFIRDARSGERASYRNESGQLLTFTVELAVPGAPDREPAIHLLVSLEDAQGKPLPYGAATYEHRPARHGLFPLTAPNDPDGLDRLWVWTRIRQEPVTLRGRELLAWRFDLIDPALSPDDDADHVVAWLDPSIPVFGLVRWQRKGVTWNLESWEPQS